MHYSRLCAVLIDCKTPNIDAAADFWGKALPTGKRFCVVRVQRPGFPKTASRWD